MHDSERARWELKNERNKVNIRWLMIVVVGGYLSWLLHTGQGTEIGAGDLFHWWFIGGLTASTAFINLLIRLYIARKQKKKLGVHPLLKYLSMGIDFLVVSLVLIPTGGDKSMFFLVYFIVIISNSLRYGMRLTLVGLLLFNAMYVGVLAYQYPDYLFGAPPNESPFQMQAEILKLGVFWLVGLYTGYIARRFERLQGEVERYERLVARLMVRSQKPTSSSTEGAS